MLVTDDGGTTLDLSRAGITAFVKARGYGSWRSEPAPHDSTGPHGKVKTFVNDTMYGALKNGTPAFPEGSITVKELYANDGTTISGHAVDAKQNGEWTFYEGFVSSNYANPYYFRGTGNLCSDCHQAGRDMFLTPAASFP